MNKLLKISLAFSAVLLVWLIFTPKAHATQYYIDCINGNNGSAGTATSTAWLDLDQFTENARSAGDIVSLRRGAGQDCSDGTDLTFTSDGTEVDPIRIEADYDNLWSDFATSAQTGTFTSASTTILLSASYTDIVAGQWIYVSSEDARELSYQVDSILDNEIRLVLPYKGSQTGSGKSIIVMDESPTWGTAAQNFNMIPTTDIYWKMQGIEIASGDAAGGINFQDNRGWVLKDMTWNVSCSECEAINWAADDGMYLNIFKSHIKVQNSNSGAIFSGNFGHGRIYIYDSLIQPGTAGEGLFFQSDTVEIFLN